MLNAILSIVIAERFPFFASFTMILLLSIIFFIIYTKKIRTL